MKILFIYDLFYCHNIIGALMRVIIEEIQAEKIKRFEVFTLSLGITYIHKNLRIMTLERIWV